MIYEKQEKDTQQGLRLQLRKGGADGITIENGLSQNRGKAGFANESGECPLLNKGQSAGEKGGTKGRWGREREIDKIAEILTEEYYKWSSDCRTIRR